jgi:hypothetical protein
MPISKQYNDIFCNSINTIIVGNPTHRIEIFFDIQLLKILAGVKAFYFFVLVFWIFFLGQLSKDSRHSGSCSETRDLNRLRLCGSTLFEFINCYYESRCLSEEEPKIAERKAAQIVLQQAKVEIRLLAQWKPVDKQRADQESNQKGCL